MHSAGTCLTSKREFTVVKAMAALGWIAVILFSIIAAYALFVGLTFGFALWNPANPKPTLLWLGVVCAPLPIAFALRNWPRSPIFLFLSLVAACGLFAPYVVAYINR